MTTNVLLIGSGGREHALAAAIARSPSLGTLYATGTGNPGIAALARPVDVPANAREIYRLGQFCRKHNIGLVVIGPEDPLAEGWSDGLRDEGLLVFGPGQAGARLESDKAWSKKLLRAASIPTAEGRTFTDAETALAYLETREEVPVIKAAGLAKGKGVFVPETLEEAGDAVRAAMVERRFGDAGDEIVIEERLEGREVSVFALTDGASLYLLETCQDHKRLGEGDTGPNTGGMGAFSPAGTIDEPTQMAIEREILVPTLDALRREEIPFHGVLYAGLMLTHAGPKVLEYNVRFGDPECQVLMPRLRSDVLDVFSAVAAGRLETVDLEWDARAACCVVLAAEGYPMSPRSGDVISGVDDAEALEGVSVFHAGTKRRDDGALVTAGGRVLAVTALGETLADARDLAYRAADLIDFAGKTLRRDIAVASAPSTAGT